MKRKWMALLLAGLLLCLAACGDDEETTEDPEVVPEPEPFMYELEGIQVAPLPVGDDAQPTPRQLSVYTYEELPKTGAEMAAEYTETLTKSGFSFIDEELVRTEEPPLDTAEGSVCLGKKAVFPEPEPEEGEEDEEDKEPEEEVEPAPPRPDSVVLLRLDWTADTCVVTTEIVEGRITDPPEPEAEQIAMEAQAMTNQELEDYARSLSPKVFDLPGKSMTEYRIYITTGMVSVNEIPCQRLEIFHIDEESGTNEVAGRFFMSPNGEHLYRYQEDGTITELEVPEREPEAE